MKTKIFISTLMSLLFANSYAQDRTTVSAMSSEISDNLDLRAVASIFGDSRNLEDFENRLNDPKNQISNLDLNNDNQVDYLRVIETVEGNAHLIVVQSILGFDKYQDIATLEVEKDSNNRIQVQVVGDVYMYGNNYIYEPVYVSTPIIYNYFWVPNYRPYCSTWYWGYYPSFYYAWNPFPIFRYRSHIGLFINFNHHYNYVNYRRCQVAYNNYYGRRGNAYERQYPNRSFASRNSNFSNRHELDKTRNIRTVGGDTRNAIADNGTRNSTSRNNNSRDITSRNGETRNVRDENSRNNSTSRDIKSNDNTTRSNETRNVRNENSRDVSRTIKRDDESPRNNESRNVRSENSRSNSAQRDNIYSSPTPKGNESRNARNESSRSKEPRNSSFESPRNSAPRTSEQRNSSSNNSQRGGGESRSQGRR